MENNDWNIILPSLKGMFNFDDDILWTIYFNSNMDLDKTIDILIELSDEQKSNKQNSDSNFDTVSTKMITFDDIQKDKKPNIFFDKFKNSLSSLTKRNHKYNKINNEPDD